MRQVESGKELIRLRHATIYRVLMFMRKIKQEKELESETFLKVGVTEKKRTEKRGT